MQNDMIFRSLRKAMKETAERMIFREMVEAKQEPVTLAFQPGDYQVVLPVEAPFTGQIHLFFQKESAPQLVTEMVGKPVDGIGKIKDGLAEFGNIFGGLFFKVYLQSSGAYKMGLSKCVQIENRVAFPLKHVWAFNFEDVHIFAGIQKE